MLSFAPDESQKKQPNGRDRQVDSVTKYGTLSLSGRKIGGAKKLEVNRGRYS